MGGNLIPPAAARLLSLLAAIGGVVLLVAVAVGIVERRQNASHAGRYPTWRYAAMGMRRPAPLRVQLAIFLIVAGTILVIVMVGCNTAPGADTKAGVSPDGRQTAHESETDVPQALQLRLEHLSHVGGPANTVTVSGSLAFVGTGRTVTVVDLADPLRPHSLGHSQAFPDAVEDIVVVDDFAYVAAGSAGLRIMDASDPARLDQVAAITEVGPAAYPGPRPLYARGVATRGALVLVTGDALVAVDVSEPATPRMLGTVDGIAFADAAAIADDFAFVAAGPGLYVLRIEASGAPRLVGSAGVPEGRPQYGSARGIAVHDGHVFVATEGNLDETTNDESNGLIVFDVRVPSEPRVVARGLDSGGISGTGAGVAVWEDLLLLTRGSHEGGRLGLIRFDAASPAEMSVVGTLWSDGWGGLGVAALDSSVAILAASDGGLRVIETSAPDAPREIAVLHTLAQPARAAAAEDHLVITEYVGYDGGLTSVDLSDPRRPRLLGSANVMGDGLDVTYHDGHVFVTDMHYFGGETKELLVFREPSPGRIEEVASLAGHQYLKGGVVAGSRLYAIGQPGLVVVDISRPAAPRVMARVEVDGGPAAVAVSGDLAVVAARSTGNAAGGLIVFDVSRPSAPVPIGRLGGRGAVGISVIGDRAYLAVEGGEPGLWVVDLADPTAPVEIGFAPTDGPAADVEIHSGVAWLNGDFEGGRLRVFALSGDGAPRPMDISVSFAVHGYGADAALGPHEPVAVVGDLLLAADRGGRDSGRFGGLHVFRWSVTADGP